MMCPNGAPAVSHRDGARLQHLVYRPPGSRPHSRSSRADTHPMATSVTAMRPGALMTAPASAQAEAEQRPRRKGQRRDVEVDRPPMARCRSVRRAMWVLRRQGPHAERAEHSSATATAAPSTSSLRKAAAGCSCPESSKMERARLEIASDEWGAEEHPARKGRTAMPGLDRAQELAYMRPMTIGGTAAAARPGSDAGCRSRRRGGSECQ